MKTFDEEVEHEIKEMHRLSRRKTLLDSLRTGALFGAGGGVGLVALVTTQNEVYAVLAAILAAAIANCLVKRH